MKEHYEKQNEESEKANNQLQNKASNVAKPNINQTPPPTYKVKAPKK
jgi:hypothetical protein